MCVTRSTIHHGAQTISNVIIGIAESPKRAAGESVHVIVAVGFLATVHASRVPIRIIHIIQVEESGMDFLLCLML